MFHYFHGRAPILMNVSGVIFDRRGNSGKPQLMEAYKHVLRASMVARTGIIPFIIFKGATAFGAFHNLGLSESSQNTDIVNFNFQFFAFDVDLFKDEGGIPPVDIPEQDELPNTDTPETDPVPREPISDEDALRRSIINTALSQVDKVPYVSGGATPSDGFDCSGFTQWVYAQNDLSLGKHSSAQYGAGSFIPTSQLKPGDLVFFSSEEGGSSVSHVGIYKGNDEFIHSGSSTGVTKAKIQGDSYWGPRYHSAKTYI